MRKMYENENDFIKLIFKCSRCSSVASYNLAEQIYIAPDCPVCEARMVWIGAKTNQ